MTEASQFHVGIKDSVKIRKELLEGTRSVIKILQRYEKFKEIREEKKECINKLRNLMREIQGLNQRLREMFPDIPLPKPKPKSAEPEPKPKEEETEKKPEPQGLQDLNSELDRIESKLSSLQ